MRLSSIILTLSVFLVTGSAQAQQNLGAADIYAVTGVYEEQTTCYAFAMLAGGVAKKAGKSEEAQKYIELAVDLDMGKSFFGTKVGKTSDDITKDTVAALMRIREEIGGDLKDIGIAKKAHQERCDALSADPRSIAAEYLHKYSN